MTKHQHEWTRTVERTEWTVSGFHAAESCPCGARTASLLPPTAQEVSRVTTRQYPAGSLSARYADSYVSKFEGSFTAMLYDISLDCCDNEFGGVDETGAWIGQLGRHVIVEDSNGQVWSGRVLADRQASTFYAWCREWIGEEEFDAYMRGDDSI
jgi:hypothetical protein